MNGAIQHLRSLYLEENRRKYPSLPYALGRSRRIGSGTWIKTSMQPGSSDISAVINGKAVKIEIKIPGDRQSMSQRNYQEQIERAGGKYFIAQTFAEFFHWYETQFGRAWND